MSIVQEIIDVGGYEIINQFIVPSKWTRPQKRINPIGGVIHWTANLRNGADAKANRNFFNNRNGDYGSAHTIGDGKCIIAALPFKPNESEMGYHVGADKYYTTRFGSYPNGTTLGHEMCVNRDGDFRESYKRSVWIMAYWSFLFDWNPELDVVRHYDVTRKDCPLPFTDLIYNDKHCISKGWTTADIQWMRLNLQIDGVQGEKLWLKYKSEVNELYKLFKKYGLTGKPQQPQQPSTSYPTAKVMLNKKEIGTGYNINGSVHLPIRVVAEALSCKVGFDNKTKFASVNGTPIPETKLIDGTSFVPIRVCVNLLSAAITFDNINKIVYITK